MRGLRRLRRQEQLPVGAAGRDAVRAQDAHPPDELQLRHDVPHGDCPAFATVTVERRRVGDRGRARSGRARRSRPPVCPTPRPLVPGDEFIVRLSGIGGTGVITVSQILGTAAMLDGNVVRGLDQTGLSQKAGPVVSDVRVSRRARCRRRTRPTRPASTACSPSTCSPPPRRPPQRRRRRPHRGRRVRGADAHRHDGRPPHDAVPRARHPHRPAGGGVAPRAQPSTRTPPRCRPGCSATPRRPTSCCSAWPCRPAPCRCRRRRSSGRSSSTAWRSNATVAAFRWGRRWVEHPARGRAGGGPHHAGARDARRADRPPRGRPRRLPVGGLRPPLPRARRAGPGGRARRRPGEHAVHRGRGPQPAQADGVQGRVRGGPAAPAPRGAPGVRGGRWAPHQGHVAAAPADAAGARPQGQDAVRTGIDADVPGVAPGQAGARHASPTRSVGPRCAASSGR